MSHSDDCAGPLHATGFQIRSLGLQDLARCIALGWHDMVRIGWPSYLHGLLVFVFSLITLRTALVEVDLLPGVATAFVFVGPMLATGLYGMSRRVEAGKAAGIRDAFCAWRTASRCLWRFSLLLIAIGLLWIIVSALLFHFFVNMEIHHPLDFIHYVLSQETSHFILWTLAGGLFAALVFGMTVVTVPLLLDRDVTTKTAILVSIRAVGENPGPMTFWALFIGLCTGTAFATAMSGFVLLYPLMGHASWHLYRQVIEITDGEAIPTRAEAT
ncbi:MAG: DUF2189 domain-containing protein [Gammaproteobacteria bacterium]|nr:MAG: DUF2189 domain-containing protein [Gammaproteobacteria bacterium]